MKKIYIIFMLISLVLFGCSIDGNLENNEKVNFEKIKKEGIKENDLSLIEQKLDLKKEVINIGYCPTMQIYIDQIVQKDKFNLKPYSSTSEVLDKLNKGNIDVGLTGRIAKNYEIVENIKSVKLLYEERFTYISGQKILILESEIGKYSDKIKLISWNDWKDEYELAVILDEKGNKVEKYRLPILYFNKDLGKN